MMTWAGVLPPKTYGGSPARSDDQSAALFVLLLRSGDHAGDEVTLEEQVDHYDRQRANEGCRCSYAHVAALLGEERRDARRDGLVDLVGEQVVGHGVFVPDADTGHDDHRRGHRLEQRHDQPEEDGGAVGAVDHPRLVDGYWDGLDEGRVQEDGEGQVARGRQQDDAPVGIHASDFHHHGVYGDQHAQWRNHHQRENHSGDHFVEFAESARQRICCHGADYAGQHRGADGDDGAVDHGPQHAAFGDGQGEVAPLDVFRAGHQRGRQVGRRFGCRANGQPERQQLQQAYDAEEQVRESTCEDVVVMVLHVQDSHPSLSKPLFIRLVTTAMMMKRTTPIAEAYPAFWLSKYTELM